MLSLVLLADVIWLFLLNFVASAAALKPFCSAHDCHCRPSVLLHSFPFDAQLRCGKNVMEQPDGNIQLANVTTLESEVAIHWFQYKVPA
jgi:hypothetical protein